jgi:hypothetical protein
MIYFPTTTNSLYGPASISALIPPNTSEAVKVSGIPAVNGEFVLGMGKRYSRPTAVGVLITGTQTSMNTLNAAIEANVGSTGYLKDNFSRVYSSLRLISFEHVAPRSKNSGVQQPFRCVFVKAG